MRAILAACVVGMCGAVQVARAGAPGIPFPQHTSYAAGTIKPNHRSQTQLDADVVALYDSWKANYVLTATTPVGAAQRYRISVGGGNPGRTVSEGQGYGMLATAIMAGHDPAARTVFDGLWRFTRDNPSVIDSRLMAWQVPQDPGGSDSAFDGDCDMAYALLLADRQWGSDGDIDYRAAFNNVIAGMLASTIGPQSRLPMLGDWVNPAGTTYNQWSTRSSDFTYGHFRAFATASGNGAWTQVLANTQGVATSLQANFSPLTGLLPDFVVRTTAGDTTPRPAPSGFLEGPNDGKYYYNAFRDPWRIATDALLAGDPVSLAQARRLTDWAISASSGVPSNLRAGYALDGTPVSGSNYFTSVVAAPFAVAAMTRPSQQAWLNALYDSVRTRHEDYYEDSVSLLCMIVLSGNWWDPTLMTPPACTGDTNGDGMISGADLSVLLSQFGDAVAPGSGADLNDDGSVNGADLSVLLGRFGTSC